MDDKPQKKLDLALAQWREYWGEDLEAVYLYGSAARGDWSAKSSDINLLLQVNTHDYSRWPGAAAVARRLNRKGFALPLVLSRDYILSSLDVYPMEFLDIKLFREVLHGEDLFAGIEIRKEHLRLQAEREVKGKWVQLRQAAMETGGNTAAMRNLLVASVPTWVSVFQALLFIEGREVPREKVAVLGRGAELTGVDASLFLELAEIRREKKGLNRAGAWKLLKRALEQLDRLARWVDVEGGGSGGGQEPDSPNEPPGEA